MYRYFFFDLDGTLTDPGLGITNSVMYALKKFGIEVHDRAELYRFIGPPLMDSFTEFYHFSQDQAEEAVVYYREYFKDKGIFENTPYDGISEVLAAFRDAGKRLVLATSKPEEFSVRILKKFGLYQYFDFIGAATMDERRTQKNEVITYALEHLGITERSSVLMIGDRKYDILGAAELGIDGAGVLYGYGSREELQKAGAKYILRTPQEITHFLQE